MSYSIKEVSQKFNISSYTLRYYEKEGLLPPIQRTANGTRQYSDVDLEWLQLICCMRATGMSIAYIKDYVELCRLGENTIPQRRQIILRQKEIIENHIKEYKDLLKLVNKKLKYYDNIMDSGQNILNPQK
ncbi:DNA-binding transcriptional regulator, MerR family [Desulfotomaculum arcticum]|uniref:DNA-binding transcriptional regulator, MerR family n=1 Tax=Desulfotruncus arcticus DSM 17038 TaxID=1121424 RepID=A0A1I2XQD9_9FIRM|nr:MerR family transcriptional regulator [Desulfotruncus arcticus]SFH15703.1 DNA-binding transcriptional regulator, MerR family [Desulfotomaculum arcticum] [Desulfotruncus arcticus DSM 17038]